MSGRWKGGRSFMRRYKRANIVVGFLVLLLIAVLAGFNLTKEKAQETSSKIVKVENKDSENMSENPLKLDNYPEVTKIVQDYYRNIGENTGFVESYNNIKVYTKAGKYANTYVIFARYDMKIKDVYTEVPGLGTLYVEKNKENGKYHVTAEVNEEKTKAFIEKVASHEDVKELMNSIQADYTSAVESDAILKEALMDLQSAAQTQPDGQ